ncbi:pathogenesis-related homeodomain protein [Abeliophyllum distichum]|uniref:Pathogenesis-related homeodomain protein n=1 Tax=Abeliophyllum distichum TaxID=126358 RepID=A0ABD1PH15_9LAMI
MEETTGFEEVGPTPRDVAENFSAERRGPLLENIKTSSVIENLEGPPENKAMTVVLALGYFGTRPGLASVNPLSGQAEPTQKDVNNASSLLKAEDEGTSVHLRTKRSTSKSSANSQWVLRSKSQEKPKASDPKAS